MAFSDLLQQAEQLTADMDSGWELPRIDRNLHQLAEAGQRLWSKTRAAGDSAGVKAWVTGARERLTRLASRLLCLFNWKLIRVCNGTLWRDDSWGLERSRFTRANDEGHICSKHQLSLLFMTFHYLPMSTFCWQPISLAYCMIFQHC